jgi:hypothetical protein
MTLGAAVFVWLGPLHSLLVVFDAILAAACAGVALVYGTNSVLFGSVTAVLILMHPSVTVWRLRARSAARQAALVETVADVIKEKLKQSAGRDYPVEHMRDDLADSWKYGQWPAAFREVATDFGDKVDITKISKNEYQSLWPLAKDVVESDGRITISNKKLPGLGRALDCFYLESSSVAKSPAAGTSNNPFFPKPPVPVQQQAGSFLAFGGVRA